MRDLRKKGSQFICMRGSRDSVVEKQWTNGQLMARKNLKKGNVWRINKIKCLTVRGTNGLYEQYVRLVT